MVVRTVALSSIGSTLLVCLSCLQTTAYYSSPFLSATSTKRNICYIVLCIGVEEVEIMLQFGRFSFFRVIKLHNWS